MKIDNKTFECIQALVGESVTQENLAFVDCFVHEWFGMFLPVGGNCGYAISPSHKHPSFMFVVAYDNQSVVYVEDEKFETAPDTFMCLSPEVEHHEVQNYLPPKYCAICVDKEKFEKSFKLYTDEVADFKGLVVGTQNSKLDSLIKEFILESQNTHASRDIILENLSSLLTHELIRTILNCNAQNSHVTENQKINEAVKFINANYEKEISLEDIALCAELSKSHFTKCFTQTMKTTPMEYVKHIRLQNAKKMLLSHKLSVTTISQQCGFNSPSYFSKTFKETYNETPKEFARRGK